MVLIMKLIQNCNFSQRHVPGLIRAPMVLFEKGNIEPEIICSNLKDLVDQQQYIFDNFWNRSLPAHLKIREIDRNRSAMINPRSETKVLES